MTIFVPHKLVPGQVWTSHAPDMQVVLLLFPTVPPQGELGTFYPYTQRGQVSPGAAIGVDVTVWEEGLQGLRAGAQGQGTENTPAAKFVIN